MNSDKKQKVFIWSIKTPKEINPIFEFMDGEFEIVYQPNDADLIVIDIDTRDFIDNFKNPLLNDLRNIPNEWFRLQRALIPFVFVNLSGPEVSKIETPLSNILGVEPHVLSTQETILSQLEWLSYFSKKASIPESLTKEAIAILLHSLEQVSSQ